MNENVDFKSASIVEVHSSGDKETIVKDIQTDHRGKGTFSFTPLKGYLYYFVVNLGGPNSK